MRPGDLVTCTCCGAQARATWSSQVHAWREGDALSLRWTHGPHPRHQVTHVTPALCIWCHERRQVLGPDAEPLYRPVPGTELASIQVSLTESVDSLIPPSPPPPRGQLSLL